MSGNLPPERPRLSFAALSTRVAEAGLDVAAHPVFVAGLRGYYADSMGAPHVNDRGIYDDAVFLVSASHFSAYNANTDPSSRRPGSGFGANKGMARLQPGVWNVYRFDIHQGPKSKGYPALCQRGGSVDVMRDGNPDYPDSGAGFGINIHRGAEFSTSSAGCQTIHPSQWPAFIAAAEDQLRRYFGIAWKTTTIPYVLMEAG